MRLRLAGRTLHTNTVNIAVAVAFAVMGGFVIYLAGSSEMTRGPGFQVAVGRWLSGLFTRVEAWLAPVPEPVLGLVVLALAGVFVYATVTDRRRRPADDDIEPEAEPSAGAAGNATGHACHHSSDSSRSGS